MLANPRHARVASPDHTPVGDRVWVPALPLPRTIRMMFPEGTPRYWGDTHTHAAPGHHCTRTRSRASQSWFQITWYARSSGHPLGAHDVYRSPSQCANFFNHFCSAATITHLRAGSPWDRAYTAFTVAGQKWGSPAKARCRARCMARIHTHTHTQVFGLVPASR